jgi:hypothetical protein
MPVGPVCLSSQGGLAGPLSYPAHMFLEAQVAPWEETGVSVKCLQEVVGCLLLLTSVNSEQLSSQSPLVSGSHHTSSQNHYP